MARSKVNSTARYQVVYDGDKSPPPEDFKTKVAAQTRVDELAKNGIKAHVWDTLDNPLSRMFGSLFKP